MTSTIPSSSSAYWGFRNFKLFYSDEEDTTLDEKCFTGLKPYNGACVCN